MKVFGFEITRAKAVPVASPGQTGLLQSVDSTRGWWPIIRESFAGAWQRNVEITIDNVTTHPIVFACITLISNDIAKCRARLVQEDRNGIWNEVESAAFSPVLRKPNHYQNRIQFMRWWVLSMLLHGNAYVLKVRDNRQVVRALYVLDPTLVRPLVAPNGDVYYELKKDDLSLLPDEGGVYMVPASEVIHDHWNEFFHPLVGLSPIYAAGLAAIQGLNIQNNSAYFFQNGSNPGSVIEVPGDISKEVADRIKSAWDTGFTGDNAGKVAVLANGMKYSQLKVSAVDSQVVEQLKWTAETICSVFHVPAHMVGVGPAPAYNNIEALNQQYYSQCLQILIEQIEACLDQGLGLTTGEIAAERYGVEFDKDDLLRMDSQGMMAFLRDGTGAGLMAPNEGRKKLNLSPVKGGESPMLQQQNWSLADLAERREQGMAPAPPTTPTQLPQPEEPPAVAAPDNDEEKAVRALHLLAASMQAGNWATKCLQP